MKKIIFVYTLIILTLYGCHTPSGPYKKVIVDTTDKMGNRVNGIEIDGRRMGVWNYYSSLAQLDSIVVYDTNGQVNQSRYVFNSVEYQVNYFVGGKLKRSLITHGKYYAWKYNLGYNDNINIESGNQIFQANCQQCHHQNVKLVVNNYDSLFDIIKKYGDALRNQDTIDAFKIKKDKHFIFSFFSNNDAESLITFLKNR